MAISLTDRINALEYLALAHIAATARTAPDVARQTIAYAEDFAGKLAHDGYPASAQQLQSLAQIIRVGGDLPAND